MSRSERLVDLLRWIELRWRLRRAKTPAERTTVRRSVGARWAKRKPRAGKETTA